MREKSTFESIHFNQQFKIHGHLAHDKVPVGKIRWWIYRILDIPCNKIIVGSSQDPKARWANYKSSCNLRKSNGTGLCKHFMEGCPNDQGPDKFTLDFTLIDYYDTTDEKLRLANHVSGPKCRCKECGKLKDLEDRHIMRVGSFYGNSGLNQRNEVKRKTRCQWSQNPG